MTELYGSIDLGGTTTACALGDEQGRILAHDEMPTDGDQGPEDVLARIRDGMQRLVSQLGAQPAAIGMGVPGLIDYVNGVTRFLPNLATQWHGVRVRDTLAPALGCPVYLLNDVRSATLGELVFGHGRQFSSFAFYALGTGVGGGIVIDGKLRLGADGAAGELGHMTLVADGPRCGCGNRGCLEVYASGTALRVEATRLLLNGRAPKLLELTGGDLNAVAPEKMAQAAQHGDEEVREIIVRAAEWLGIGISNVITALHPEAIVLGGGVADIGELLFDTVRRTIRERVLLVDTDEIAVVRSQLGPRAGLLGGIALAMKGGLMET